MSGLGFLQAPCLTFISFAASRMCCAAKPSIQVRNGRITPLKCTKTTNVRAEVRTDDLKGGDGRCVFPELTIQEIPYVDEVVKKLAQNSDAFRKTESDLAYLEEAYERCRLFCSERYKNFSTALRVFPEDKLRALLAIHAWARRIDDSVDSSDDDNIRSANLDQWEERTKDIFNGRPHDILDAAAVDTISKYHMDTKPFEDVLKGMRMDITKKRYANFEELFLYCYYVAGTIGIMVFQMLDIATESTMSTKTIYDGAVYFGIAFQLTNILNDVSDDAQLGRVYLPQDELAQFGLCDDDILSRKVSDGWREFMKMQIQRARFYYDLAEQGVSQLDKATRSKMLSAMMVYGHLLDIIEEMNYDNLTKKVTEFDGKLIC